jgi:hypothetical protein
MSEYIFPKTFSYTEGSGSGSGGDMIPCEACAFPPGTNIDTHYQDTSVLVRRDAENSCCPTLPRTKNCFNCGFTPGTNAETHYVNTNAQVAIDAAGDAECCPVLPKPPNPQLYPCVNCGLGDNSIDDFYIDITAQVSTEGGCCPVVPRDDNECDPACEECEDCINGNCVERDSFPCVTCDDGGSLFPPGTSIDTHYIDVSVRNCVPDQCCPVVERDDNNPDQETTVIYVGEGEVKTCQLDPRITKTGPGTVVIIPPPVSNPPVFPPICKLLNIQEGNCILKPGVESGFTSTDTKITFGKLFTCGFGILGNSTISVNSIDFGSDVRDGGDSGFSYTSNETAASNETIYNGKINIGYGRINIAQNGINSATLRNLLISGRNGGSWDGDVGFVTDIDVNGIKSIGYKFNDDGSTTVAWAAPGDTNLDGVIDILDVSDILASNKYDNGEFAHWFEGDFNYDGVVDILDVSLFLGTNSYDTGSYLPQNTSFDVSWNPKTVFYNFKIDISTQDVTKAQGIRTYEPVFYKGNIESRIVCQQTTSDQCVGPDTVFTPNKSCHDAVCDSLDIPKQTAGACCYEDSPYREACVVLNDTPYQKAEDVCYGYGGTWNGYNTVCSDSSCITTQVISDKPVVNTNTGTGKWGGCCVGIIGGQNNGNCVILWDADMTAKMQCEGGGGIWYGYNNYCSDTCNGAYVFPG